MSAWVTADKQSSETLFLLPSKTTTPMIPRCFSPSNYFFCFHCLDWKMFLSFHQLIQWQIIVAVLFCLFLLQKSYVRFFFSCQSRRERYSSNLYIFYFWHSSSGGAADCRLGVDSDWSCQNGRLARLQSKILIIFKLDKLPRPHLVIISL